MYFPFPVKPLAEATPVFSTLRPPFFVHVREPEHSAASVVAKYLNNAVVSSVDLGLLSFKSFRVDAYALPGPTPIPPLTDAAAAAANRALPGYGDGFCVTRWFQDAGEHSPLRHEDATLPGSIDHILNEATL